MSLEDIIELYGCEDYYDMNSGLIYHLSEIKDEPAGTYPVRVSRGGNIIGTAKVRKND